MNDPRIERTPASSPSEGISQVIATPANGVPFRCRVLPRGELILSGDVEGAVPVLRQFGSKGRDDDLQDSF